MDSLGVEIDRELFITCRLCLEESGVYQIVPSVQVQINYCFGIIVEHFDGLPQLVCKKCKLLLNEYSKHKQNFIEKQLALKKKLQEKLQKDSVPDQQESDSNIVSTENGCKNSSTNGLTKKSVKHSKKRNRLFSSSSSDSFEPTILKKKKRKNSNNHVTKLATDWKKHYAENFICRLCSKKYTSKKNASKHYYDCHRDIRKKHKKILDVKCIVHLEKLDCKPNPTGLLNTVVLTKNKIVQDDGADEYYTEYTAPNKLDTANVEADTSTKCNINNDSSDDVLASNKPRKRFRLDSGSSTDTVFIGDNNNADVLDADNKIKLENPNVRGNADVISQAKDTICIDDSSDSDMELNTHTAISNHETNIAKNKTEAGKLHTKEEIEIGEKIIKEIISVCRTKYETRKKLQIAENADKTQESLLKHKILSIGRKTINGKGFNNCMGLLRYLEHKNLNVTWESKSQMQAIANKGGNFVRMLIRNIIKPIGNNDESGWVDLEPEQLNTPDAVSLPQQVVSTHLQVKQGSLPLPQVHFLSQQMVQDTTLLQNLLHRPHIVPNIVQQTQIVQQPHAQQTTLLQQPQGQDQAVLYKDVVNESNTQKLLNPNPVANPKQLPKKNYLVETKTTAVNMGENNEEIKMVMPVITSTTSLAETKKDNKTQPKDNAPSISDRPGPRIKVKPASELMKPGSTMNNSVNQLGNIWDYNKVASENENSMSIFVPNNLMSQIQTQSVPLPNVLLPNSSNSLLAERASPEPKSKNTSDFIILDSVELPNTKTESPFKYFRNLLLLRGIILLEANATLSSDFECLLKFKVQFKQENKNLTLCLSLFCNDNRFCMNVKDGNLINIHMAKMSANWQWEILKVYQGDVTNKILQNAQKYGQNIYSKTKTFLLVLKSINQV